MQVLPAVWGPNNVPRKGKFILYNTKPLVYEYQETAVVLLDVGLPARYAVMGSCFHMPYH